MQNPIKCSFCQKSQGVVRGEVASSHTRTVSICSDCLKVCRGILKKNIKSGAKSGSYRISSSRPDLVEPLCCSFCDTPQHVVDKLIGSAPGRTRTYICDKCVAAGTLGENVRRARPPKNFWHWIARRFGIHNSQLRHTPNY